MNELKKRRLELELSQEKLAELSGVSRNTISTLETGELTIAKSSTILALAKALKIDAGKLLCPKG